MKPRIHKTLGKPPEKRPRVPAGAISARYAVVGGISSPTASPMKNLATNNSVILVTSADKIATPTKIIRLNMKIVRRPSDPTNCQGREV
ncbi:MAG: hypothetical protein M1368_11060 [Thaumarchaeota archaeon]|nr:hypothetical protein [Nitrososphaerota archaeon]